MSLADHLEQWAAGAAGGAPRREIAQTVLALAEAAARLAERISLGPLRAGFAEVVGSNPDGDEQAALDVEADELFRSALRHAPVAVIGSEEHAAAHAQSDTAPLVVVIDPLDGSSNIETNVSVGTIFGILPMTGLGPDAVVLQAGRRLLAAGMVVYGPQTTLALTLGEGTALFHLDPRERVFVCTNKQVKIPDGRPEYAINSSNYRHWDAAIRAYIDDCIAGVSGPRGRNFNTRWLASLVAETRAHPQPWRRLSLPGRPPAGLRARPATAGLRGQSDRHADRGSRWCRHRRHAANPGPEAARAA